MIDLETYFNEHSESIEYEVSTTFKKDECECGVWHIFPNLRYNKSYEHNDWCRLFISKKTYDILNWLKDNRN